MEFNHLHCHSEYSLLDGLPSVQSMIERTVANGQNALAMTDHGNMHGVVDFYRQCTAAKIHPVIGCEFYATPFGTDHTDKTRGANHLLAFASNQKGYQNLLHLSALSHQLGKYYKPRVTQEWLLKYGNGIVLTSGCMAAHIPSAILAKDYSGAEEMFKWYHGNFGENFFVELQYHPGIPELHDMNKKLIQFAKQYDVKCIITNDTHYSNPEDAPLHDILLCVQTKTTLDTPKRMKFTDNEYYLKTGNEMFDLFSKYMPADEVRKAIENTNVLAHSLQANPAPDVSSHIPTVLSSEIEPNSFLKELVLANVANVYPDWQIRQDVKDQIDLELQVIKDTNFANYFITIWDICNFANKSGITFNTRGSAAGSIVNYIIGVSNVDPILHKLMFSRFLNKFRVNIPDCDLDFEDDRRQEIADYIVEKYGNERVAKVVTFNRLKARASIRDVARVMGMPQWDIDLFAKSISGTAGKPITIANSQDAKSPYYSQRFVDLINSSALHKEVAINAAKIEKVIRQTGIHAAALLIGDKPLIEYSPLMTAKNVTGWVTQLDYPTSESIGLLKVDLLGLATLSIIRECCKLINKRHGTNITYGTIPYLDETAFRLLRDGNTTGVFQLENSGMRRYLVQMQPKEFNDVAAMVALYRPGPMQYIDTYIERKNGTKELTHKHPLLEKITDYTYGIMVYQEQVNRAFIDLAGYNEGDADKIRKAIGKKTIDEIEKHRKIFVAGCEKNNIAHDVAESIYDDINEFALYGFNAAHAASYARLALITAWLKANYPLEYICACLVIEGDDNDKRTKYIEDAKANHIEILPPQIGGSFDFSIKGDKIIFGLKSINGIGEGVAKSLSKCKQTEDVLSLKLKKNQIESLVYAGCFDDLYSDRHDLVANIDDFNEYLVKASKWLRGGQNLLIEHNFTAAGKTTSNLSIALKEYDSLGAWLKFHPLMDIQSRDLDAVDKTNEILGGDKVRLIVVVTGLEHLTTSKNKPMIKFIGVDQVGSIEILVGTKLCAGLQIKNGNIVHITGDVNDSTETSSSMFASTIKVIK